jgi:hypothetical protein
MVAIRGLLREVRSRTRAPRDEEFEKIRCRVLRDSASKTAQP